MIDKFCTKGIRFAKDRLYHPPSEGGLGLINLKALLISQQSIWIKRASTSTRDNWRLDMWISGSGNCLCPDPQILHGQGKVISAGIANSFRTFSKAYYSIESNILDSFVLNNPLITTENNFPYNLDTAFWTQNALTNIRNISKLRIRDFLQDGKLKSLNNLNNEFQINITVNIYFRLSNLFWHLLKRCTLDKKSRTLAEFFACFKKGSKQCRKILLYTNDTGLDRVMYAFLDISRANVDDAITFKSSIGLWNVNCIPNGLREFIFQFYHNRLPLNTRVSNFADISRWCTFCNIVGNGMGPFDNETFVHLFIQCPSVASIHRKVEVDLFGLDPDPEPNGERWLGLEGNNVFLRLFILTVQQKIWESKLKHSIPNANYCIGEAIYTLDHACKVNKRIRESLNSLLCPLSRLWIRLTRPRW
jgi:hypothetical protein